MLFAFVLSPCLTFLSKLTHSSLYWEQREASPVMDCSIFLCCLAWEAALCPISHGEVRPAQLFQVEECLTRLCVLPEK